MRLLITTQAVDLDDPVLGFFHSWIVELAKRNETVHVICLKEGRHDLPKNVFVHSLGKEDGRSRIKYLLNFYGYVWKFRRGYDMVFVHMNPEYVCLGGFLWRLWGKRVGLWYVHKRVTLRLRVALFFSNVVYSASRGSFNLKTNKLHIVGHGIDTNAFAPAEVPPKSGSVLFLGRLDPVKHVEEFVRALDTIHEQGVSFSAMIVGDPTEKSSKYAHDVRNLASALCLEGVLSMHPAVTNEAARDFYRSYAIYCNLTPTGSFDKTILEAMSSGAVCVVANASLSDVIDQKFMTDGTPDRTAEALKNAIEMSVSERQVAAGRNRSFVERKHSLPSLIGEITDILNA